jgi:tetratricopeptide (TPR) repeat protein
MPALHLAFIEALASAGEGTPAWHAVKAGWLVMRFVDKWAGAAIRQDGDGPWLREVHAIHEAIARVAAGPDQRALELLYQHLLDSWGRRSVPVSAAMLAYAGRLERDEAWALAADVHETFVVHASTDADHELAPDAYLRLAYCLRRAGRIDEAATAYGTAGALASAAGNIRTGLLARIGAARVLKHRGNLPAAVIALDAIVADAEAVAVAHGTAGLTDALARAKHDRGALAYDMGAYAEAVALYYDALERYGDDASRERVLGDIATNFAALGLRDAARDANLVLLATAREPSIRHTAACNLMELAQVVGAERDFESYRRLLADATLSPELEAHVRLAEGEGLLRFGHEGLARQAFEAARVAAESVQLHAVAFRASEALAAQDRRALARRDAVREAVVPEAITHVVTAVRRMRELAGAPLR